MVWAERGACRDADPDSLFVPGAAQHRATRICGSCPVRLDCLAEALDNRMEFGIWGGMTERQRREPAPSAPRYRVLASAAGGHRRSRCHRGHGVAAPRVPRPPTTSGRRRHREARRRRGPRSRRRSPHEDRDGVVDGHSDVGRPTRLLSGCWDSGPET
ncbi:MAG: WhiB family transcriptional regulator [Geodermatophilaceae bacterium]